MRRRSLLLAAAAAFAGCSRRSAPGNDPPRGTVTPVPVPEEPRDSGAISPDRSRFDPAAPCPDGVTCFHRLDGTDLPAVYVAPSRETYSPANPTGRMHVHNDSGADAAVVVDWRLLKHTGHRWAPIRAPRVGHIGAVGVDPGGRWRRPHGIERTFGLQVLGPGLYARVESVRRRGMGERSVGALFAVEGTTFRLAPPAGTRPGAEGDPASGSGVSLRRVDVVDAVELVPEAVGAVPAFRAAAPRLRREPRVELRIESVSAALDRLGSATVRDRPVAAGTPLSVLDLAFEVVA